MIHINTDCYSQGFKQVAPLQNDQGYIAYWKAKAKLSFLGENKPKKMFWKSDNPNIVVQQSFKYL